MDSTNTQISPLFENKGQELARLGRRQRSYFLAFVALTTFIVSLGLVILGVPEYFSIVVWSSIILMLGAVLGTSLLAQAAQNALRDGYTLKARKLSKTALQVNLALFPLSFTGLTSAISTYLQLLIGESRFVEVEALAATLSVAARNYTTAFSGRGVDAMLMNFRAIAYLGMSRFEDANALFRECLKTVKGLNKSILLNNIGICELALGHDDEAYRMLTASADNASTPSQKSVRLAVIYPSLVRACVRKSLLAEANQMIGDSLAFLEKSNKLVMQKANCYRALGELRAAQDKTEEAEQHFLSALEMMRGSITEMHPSMQETTLSLADVMEKLGKTTEANELRGQVQHNRWLLQDEIEKNEHLFADTEPGALFYRITTQ